MNPLTEYWIQIYRQAAREDGLSPETAEALFRQLDVLRAELTHVTTARHKADAQAGALARELVQTKLLLTEAKADRDEALEELTNSRAMQSTIDTLTHELTQTRAEAGAEVERVHAKLTEMKANHDVEIGALFRCLGMAPETDASKLKAEIDKLREDWVDNCHLKHQAESIEAELVKCRADLVEHDHLLSHACQHRNGLIEANKVLDNQIASLVEELRKAKELAASASTAQLRAFEGKDRYREDVAKLTAALAQIKVVVEDRMTEYYPHTALDQILKTVRGIAP